jgi:hypothetical protein
LPATEPIIRQPGPGGDKPLPYDSPHPKRHACLPYPDRI